MTVKASLHLVDRYCDLLDYIIIKYKNISITINYNQAPQVGLLTNTTSELTRNAIRQTTHSQN